MVQFAKLNQLNKLKSSVECLAQNRVGILELLILLFLSDNKDYFVKGHVILNTCQHQQVQEYLLYPNLNYWQIKC